MKQHLKVRGPTFFRTGSETVTIPANSLKAGTTLHVEAVFVRSARERLKAKRKARSTT